MKKLILAVAAVMVSVAAFAQGQITFNNRVAGVVDARVTFADGANIGQGVGAGYTAQLFGGPDGTAAAALTALSPNTTFRTSSAAAQGYVNGVVVDVPGIAPGLKASIQMRVFDSGNLQVGQSAPISITLGGGTLPPANLEGLQAFTVSGGVVIPEPSTIALAALGVGALLLRRRK
ncbi:MAG: PEP-CTERM sorting domain-containing protein [Verrucomicrobiales bacterium]|nr:PEP-CTERM sorting domain-containing protein [Verrucomicrobiales bacterium]